MDGRSTGALLKLCIKRVWRICYGVVAKMLEVSQPGAAALPDTVKQILQASLKLRDRRDRNLIGKQGLAIARGRLEARLDRVLNRNYRAPANQRLANHLRRERDAMFTFLYCPGLDATNYRAEQAIRPMVVTRKVWGGNRTEKGAYTQGVLVSIYRLAASNSGPQPRSSSNCSFLPRPKLWS